MIFTSRTYRVAIRRSIRKEAKLNRVQRASVFRPMDKWLPSYLEYEAQYAHTRRLQARKRKERK